MERDLERLMPQSNQDTASKISLLREFIDAETVSLRRTLCAYVFYANLRGGETVPNVARELLQDVVQEALHNAERFDPTRSPEPWLLGIAANLIKRRQAEMTKRTQREPFGRDLHAAGAENLSDDELFSRLAKPKVANPTENLEVDDILSRVSEDDREILRLAVIHEFNGETLAQKLGIKAGAARVRLHRALERLRQCLP
jgi:RNA polymerase sigma factor (sigma-70 family)